MTNINPDSAFWFFVKARMLTSVGLPLVFVPIMAASYDGIPPHKTDQASALLNAARNTGAYRAAGMRSRV
jgi:DHA2 family multidrug resistance protein